MNRNDKRDKETGIIKAQIEKINTEIKNIQSIIELCEKNLNKNNIKEIIGGKIFSKGLKGDLEEEIVRYNSIAEMKSLNQVGSIIVTLYNNLNNIKVNLYKYYMTALDIEVDTILNKYLKLGQENNKGRMFAEMSGIINIQIAKGTKEEFEKSYDNIYSKGLDYKLIVKRYYTANYFSLFPSSYKIYDNVKDKLKTYTQILNIYNADESRKYIVIQTQLVYKGFEEYKTFIRYDIMEKEKNVNSLELEEMTETMYNRGMNKINNMVKDKKENIKSHKIRLVGIYNEREMYDFNREYKDVYSECGMLINKDNKTIESKSMFEKRKNLILERKIKKLETEIKKLKEQEVKQENKKKVTIVRKESETVKKETKIPEFSGYNLYFRSEKSNQSVLTKEEVVERINREISMLNFNYVTLSKTRKNIYDVESICINKLKEISDSSIERKIIRKLSIEGLFHITKNYSTKLENIRKEDKEQLESIENQRTKNPIYILEVSLKKGRKNYKKSTKIMFKTIQDLLWYLNEINTEEKFTKNKLYKYLKEIKNQDIYTTTEIKVKNDIRENVRSIRIKVI